jgi:hypothetical protein
MTYITSTHITSETAAEGYQAILDALPTTEPDGLLARYAGPSDDGFVVTAVWTSPAAWTRFATELLGPAVASALPPDSGTARTVEYEAVEEYLASAEVS